RTTGGESFLIDPGYPDQDRDAKRILAAAQKAGLSRIDHVLISHFHGDHEGGLRALSKMIPIGKFYDHGDVIDEVDRGRLNDYKEIAGRNRNIVKPGDQIELKGGVKVLVVASQAKFLDRPVNSGAPNSLREPAPQRTNASRVKHRTTHRLGT